MYQILFFHVNFLRHDIYFPIQMILIRHKTWYPPPLKYISRVIITDNKSLLSLWTWFIFLRLLLKSLPPMTAIEVKTVSPILNVDGSIYFPAVIFSFKVDQYFFVIYFQYFPRKNVSAWYAKSIIHFLLQTCIQVNPQKTPYMDVVTLDTYLTFYHKIDDTETHHIHNQA